MSNSLTDQDPLDSFDRALLGELRREVAGRSAAPDRRRVRRRALVPATIASVAAATFGVVTLGSPAAAYAVDRDSSGDITITIHRLDDAAGLQQDLADNGIKAHVSYQNPASTPPGGPTNVPHLVAPGGAHGEAPSLTRSFDGSSSQPGSSASGEEFSASTDGPRPEVDACGDPDHMPLTTAMTDGDYVITIPSGSALHHADSELEITTSGDLEESLAGLTVTFTVDGVSCGFGTMSASARPAG